MNAVAILGLSTTLLLGACASSGHCTGEFEYQQAQSLPPAAPVTGLKVTESPAALRIPPPPVAAVPLAEYYPDPANPSNQKLRCLDVPRPLVETPLPPPPAEPAKS